MSWLRLSYYSLYTYKSEVSEQQPVTSEMPDDERTLLRWVKILSVYLHTVVNCFTFLNLQPTTRKKDSVKCLDTGSNLSGLGVFLLFKKFTTENHCFRFNLI